MLSPNQALEIVAGSQSFKNDNHSLNAILSDTVGTTFANMVSVTDVALASAHKKAGIVVKKVVQSTIIVANNLKEGTNLYKNKVLKTMDSDQYTFSGSNYEHAIDSNGIMIDAFSVISLRRDNSKKYLEAMPQSTQGVHYVKIQNGNVSLIYKDALKELLTPANAKKLDEDKSKVESVKNKTTHEAIYRAYKVESIHSLTVNKETYVGAFCA